MGIMGWGCDFGGRGGFGMDVKELSGGSRRSIRGGIQAPATD